MISKERLEKNSLLVGTQRCFNVQITLFGRYECQMNVVLTLCAGWVTGGMK